ncbi:uncharacterized protein LOC144424502 [Styela clava]
MSNIPMYGFVSDGNYYGNKAHTKAIFHPEGDYKKDAYEEFKERMMKEIREELRKEMQKLIDENVYLRQILKDSGEEKKNWWKVLALALGFGIVGVATGGSIQMLTAGSIALTGNVAVGAAIGGTVGATIGGVGGYAHENKRLRSMKKSK